MANDYNDGMPPIPGSGYEQGDEPPTTRRPMRRRRVTQQTNYASDGAASPTPQGQSARPTPSVEPPRQKSTGAWKGVLGGAIAGAVVSAALIAALLGTGAIGGGAATTTATTPATPASAENTTSGQNVSIAASPEGGTVSQVVAAKCLPSVVSVYVTAGEESGIGSGVVLDTDGNIITNWHVAGDATAISVTIDGQSYDATLVGGDSSSDIAVIKAELNGATVTPMEIGDSSKLVVGDWVMTLGSPLGLDQSASSGIVSALYRNTLMTGTTGNTLYTNLIQVDAAINGGNSGGALVNDKGQLVGINTLYANGSGTDTFSGIGFAIPGNYAVDIAHKVIAGEKVTHAYIGLSCSTVNAQNAQANHLSVTQGAYVAEVAEGGPAEAAGIQVGDVITKIGDNAVDSADGFILAVRSCSVGDEVDVKFVRGGEEQTVKVTLGSDEELQALQEQQLKEQQEQYQNQMQQYEDYFNQRDDNSRWQQWPWDSFQMPWELWDDMDNGNLG
ncbi:MAG: trypsin-like peptidase domain-containing protein [Atopobiaceae bacterium]|nr:trypsin-like peptidase domain-containing protein [Atopobiaceae bacterium]